MAKLFANNTSLCFDFVRFVLLLARGERGRDDIFILRRRTFMPRDTFEC